MPSISGSIAAAGAIGGAAIGSSGAQSAASEQAAASQNAAAVQQNIANQNAANLAPFRATGQSALYSLADLYGLDASGNTAGSGTIGGAATAGGQARPSATSNVLQQIMALSGLDANGNPSTTAVPNALNQFTQSPTYQFALQQGQQALDRSAASKGLLLSGAQLKDSQSFGQGLASQQLGTYTTNLQNLYSGMVSGLNTLANAGQNSAATTGQQAVNSAGQIGQSLQNAGTALASGTAGSTSAISGGIANALAPLTASNSSYGGSGGTSPLAALINGASGGTIGNIGWDGVTST